MSYSLYHYDASGLTVYAKPRPLTTATWGTDAVALAENGSTGDYVASIDSPADEYVVYQQSGDDPASSDLAVATVDFVADKINARLPAMPMANGDVTLAASQPNYAPAKAGDAMTLTEAYDAAKNAPPTADDVADAVAAQTNVAAALADIGTMSADYQQRGEAVTLPETPPDGYGAAKAGTGANAVTIHVTDGTSALQNVAVSVTNSAGASQAWGTTDASGDFACNLATATGYQAATVLGGYTSAPKSFDVSDTATVDATMTAQTITPNASNQCAIIYYTRNPDGTAISGETISYKVLQSPANGTGDAFDGTAQTSDESDSNGLIQINLEQGLTVSFQYESGTWTPGLLIPSETTATLQDLVGGQ